MWQEISTGVSDSGNFTTTTWQTAGGTSDLHGDYDVNVTDGQGNSSTTTISVDNEDPTASNYQPSDDGYTTSSNPTVSYDSDGTGSSISYEKIEVIDPNDNDNVEASSESNSVDASGLDDGDYEVNYYLEDEAGNWNNDSSAWSFTVDTTYDIADPSLNWDTNVSDENVKMDSNVDLTIEFDNDDERPNSVECLDDGTSIDSDTNIADDGDNYVAECEFDIDDYSGDTVNLELDVSDEAGNSETYEEGDYTFDVNDPTLDDLSTVVSTVKENFEVTYDSSDDSSVSSLEYFFDDDSVDEGDGNQVGTVDGDFDADVSDLDSGDHTLYVRVQDSVGRWSSVSSLDFSYLPGASRELSLSGPQSLEVTAGKSTSFDVDVENTGKLLVGEADISVSGPGASGSETVVDLYPDDTINVSFDVAPSESDIGEKEVTVSADNMSASTKIPLRVKASQSQSQSIESKLSDYESRLNEMQSDVDNLKQKGLSSSLEKRLNDNFTGFRNTVEKASREVDSGNYYKAQSTLGNVDQQYSTAQTAYTNVKEQREINQRNRIIMGAVALLLLVGVGGGGFYMYRSDQEMGQIMEKLDLDKIKYKLDDITDSEPEADDFEWDGFN